MSEYLSPLRLALMERRFDKMKQNDALREYRRSKATAKPGTASASLKSQALVKEIKALEGATAKARQNALDAFTKSPGEEFAASVRQSAKLLATEPPEAKRHVVMKAPLANPDIPFKSMSIVFEIGATIGNKVALDQRDETLAGENIPSFMLSISKLGSDDYRVYPSFEAAKSAADKDNAALDAYMRSAAKTYAQYPASRSE